MMFALLLAQLEPEIHWPATVQTLIGIVGLLAIVWLILSVAIACKKLFGKRPPVHEELARLREEFMQGDESLLAAIKIEAAARERAISDINVSRAATLVEINTRIDELPSRIVADLLNAKNLFGGERK